MKGGIRRFNVHMAAAVAAALVGVGATLGNLGRITGFASGGPAIVQNTGRRRVHPAFGGKAWLPSGARNPRTRRKKHRAAKPVRRWKAHSKKFHG